MPELLTPKQARAALNFLGRSIADFAREHELPEATVYKVLKGAKKGVRGDAHRAAVLLGLKAGAFEAALEYPAELRANDSAAGLEAEAHRDTELLDVRAGTLPQGIPSFQQDPACR